jgi:hypothetical protein
MNCSQSYSATLFVTLMPVCRYSREVLRSLAAGKFTMDGLKVISGSPVHLIDDNIMFVTNDPLQDSAFVQSAVIHANICTVLRFVQTCALKAQLHEAHSKYVLVGLEQVGSIPDSVTASVFGKIETYSCYKAVFIHAPRCEENQVRYVPGLVWPEDVAFAHMLACRGLHLLKVRWPYRFAKNTAVKSTASAKHRFAVADLLAPWRKIDTLSHDERTVLNEVC